MNDAFNPQWSNISPYSGRYEILCDEYRPEPPDFTKKVILWLIGKNKKLI